MRVPYRWLNEFVPVAGQPAEAIAEGLTLQGVSVEEIDRPSSRWQGIVCGRILSIEPHPEADRLQVCRVDAGRAEPLQIVSGAPNLEAGRWAAVALDGALLPDGTPIRSTTLRGVLSQGMLCSARELGLPLEVPPGVLLLPADSADSCRPGLPLEECLGCDDPVLVLELTPNYAAHCQSIYGVAVEVAALVEKRAAYPDVPLSEDPAGRCSQHVSVRLEAPDGCWRYVARVIRGVRVGPSPLWMQLRLLAAGMRPVNNIVDITNYVMLEFGQPLHAFDLDRLHGGRIEVRRAREGERIVTLDGRDRLLEPSDLVIADGLRPVAIAGVMGGKDAEVGEQTNDILLESASFEPMTVARTARRLGLRTEASIRYEKGGDPNMCTYVADRAAHLMQELAGGRVLSGAVDVYPRVVRPANIPLRLDRVNRVLGTSLTEEEVEELLARLQFKVHRRTDGDMRVEIPTRRVDVVGEVDLIEEIGRIYGYNRIPVDLPRGEIDPASDLRRSTVEQVRGFWRQAGLTETVNLPFLSPQEVARWQWADEDARSRTIPLANPLSQEQSLLRTSLLPSLLATVDLNVRRGQHDLALFEMARVFLPEALPLRELPREVLRLALALSGDWIPPSWLGSAQEVDFYLVKGLLTAWLKRFGLRGEVRATEQPGFHPGRTASLFVLTAGKRVEVGVFGELHPSLLRKLDLAQRVYVADLDLERFLDLARPNPVYERLPRFPAVQRDLSCIVGKDVPVDAMIELFHQAAGELLEEASLFDVYEGAGIAEGCRSLAFHLVYRAPDRTLRDEEVEALQQQIRQRLHEVVGAELRS